MTNRKSLVLAAVVSMLCTGAVFAAPGGLIPKSPDLVPLASRILTGTVSVKNVGSAPSTPSKVTVVCNKTGQRGGCADPARPDPAYIDAAFPNALTVNVPALAPGHVFNHKISFWDALVWPAGSYEFTITADAAATVAESNEGNNVGAATKTVP